MACAQQSFQSAPNRKRAPSLVQPMGSLADAVLTAAASLQSEAAT
jgi:hypothetical protein